MLERSAVDVLLLAHARAISEREDNYIEYDRD